MKVKQKAKRVVSGLLTAVTLLSTVLSPINSYAAELPKEKMEWNQVRLLQSKRWLELQV